MGNAKETFFQKLKADFYKNQSASVIYQFINQENERLYEQTKREKKPKKHSSTIQILEHLEKLSAQEESPVEYIVNLLRILKARPQLYQDSTPCEGSSSPRSSASAPQLLYALLCVCLGQPDGSSPMPAARTCSPVPSKSRIHKLLEQTLLLLEKQDSVVLRNLANSTYLREPYETLTTLTERILECATCVEVKTYFYDAGSPYNAEDYGPTDDTQASRKSKTPSKKEKPRKVDKTLGILDAYCERSGLSLFQSAHEPTMDDCEKLFELLAEEKNTQILVPLRIDGRTGCALYIVGRDYFEDSSLSSGKNNPNSCAYGILRQSTEPPIGYMLLDKFNPYWSIKPAIAEYELEQSLALAELSTRNWPLPPGTPEIFSFYGQQFAITESEISETKRNLASKYEEFLSTPPMKQARRPPRFR